MALKMFTKLIFRTLWTAICLNCLNITAGDETVTQRVLEGSDVTISTGLTGIKSDAQIQWFYGSDKADKRILNSYEHKGERFTETIERFKDHLQLNRMSGALTIRNISTDHTGLYTLQIISEQVTFRNYNIRVYGLVSTPAIINRGKYRSASRNGPCSPVCTVNNGENVTLSWYKESEIISNTSSNDQTHSDLLYLSLIIKQSDNQIYKCVATNPVSNQTTLVNIKELCNLKSESADNGYKPIAVGVSVGMSLLLLLSSAGVGIWIWRKHKKQQQGVTCAPEEPSTRMQDPESCKPTESSDDLTYTPLYFKKQDRQVVKKVPETNETDLDETQCVYAQVTKLKSAD